ncbi:hypothetical protein [Capnocytophaga gingivalis]
MKIVSIISLLLCFSLQAQQKRWQLDSIQQIQLYSNEIEYVYKTFHQSYDPKTRTVTMIDETKGEWGDRTKYICEYSPLDSLLSQTVYTYGEAIKKWEKQEMIHYVYRGAEIQEKMYRKNKIGDWKILRTSYFENIDGKLYLKKEENGEKTQKGWEVITYDPPEEWYHFSMQETAYKKNVAPKVKYNAKGEAIEMLFIRKNGYKDKQKLSYDDLGNIHELELYELRDSNIGLKKEEKRVYTYASDIPYEEVLDKWKKNNENRHPKNAILSKKVYRYKTLGGSEFIYEDRYFYSPIKQ